MKVIKISSKNFNQVVKKAIRIIKKGGIAVCPTDTIYGLIADATNEKAIKKVFKIKKRKSSKPFPIFVKNIKMAKDLAEVGKKQQRFLNRVWPGKMTIVLKHKDRLPEILLGRVKTIGLRIPKYRLINVLLDKLDLPLIGTSANISGKPGSTKIKKVLNQFEKKKFKPDLVIDAGDLKPSKASTVIDLTKSKPKILRK